MSSNARIRQIVMESLQPLLDRLTARVEALERANDELDNTIREIRREAVEKWPTD